MNNWKTFIENNLAKEYKGATIKWDGDTPTLVIPDKLENKASEIVKYVIALWSVLGGEVKFHPELAKKG